MLRSTIFGSLAVLLVACSGAALGSGNNGGASSGDDSTGDDDGRPDSGSRSDAGQSNRDAGSARDGSASGSGTDSGVSNPDNGVTNHLTFSGDCSPDMENLDVVTNTSSYDSLGVVNGSDPLDGDVQIALTNPDEGNVVALSTAERVGPPNNEVVINVMSGGVVFTNMCNVSAGGCTYNTGTKTYDGDPISGNFTHNVYDPELGYLNVAFDNVVLQSTQSTALCTVNGTLVTTQLYP